ncbi:MAG TPA: PDZ domain-containing protein [Herpetosiphonaceae bacterium]
MKIHYTLTLARPAQHLLDVTIDVADVRVEYLDFVLPTWTPGSYLIREYSRHVQEVTATADDRPATWQKRDKQTWRVAADGAERVQLRYRVYGNELTVRTNHVDDTHAHVIPAATFMYVHGATEQPLTIEVVAPDGWETATGLDADRDEQFHADDYDHLVDSPFEIGRHRTLRFEVDGKPHRIVIWGRGNEREQRLIDDTRKIVETARDLFGGLPYEHYTFFLLLAGKGAGGGLEHRNSTSLLLPRFVFGAAKSYERYLTVTCHEFFHVWNVKRIRAAGLGPFDYTQETYTTLLWAMEGITEYYTDLLLVRAGLLTPQRYLERLADDIVTLQHTPGRNLHSLECSSFDAWIKHYRPDENTVNTAASYYLKGAIVGALLDLELRRRTANERSLDDVLRYLFRAYPLDGPGIPERDGYLDAIREATGQDLSDFFARYIGGTDELPYAQIFEAAGLRPSWDWKEKAADGRSPRPALGIRTRHDGGQLRVSAVLSDGPAYQAGLSADDEIVAVDGYRVADEATLRERLNDRGSDARVSLTIFRREELRTIEVALAVPTHDRLTIEQVAQPDELPRRIYASWLGLPPQSEAQRA